MGLAMASNLQRHVAAKKALSVVYSNRTLSRGDPLKDLGGVPEKNFEAVVERSSVIFTMVKDLHPSVFTSIRGS
jgi:3-hydroxyisobutyrate dehydrogenase-like beta-hydroxyacid dehydrogenase